jgi:hypothetical protein
VHQHVVELDDLVADPAVAGVDRTAGDERDAASHEEGRSGAA